jgi:uncharacterized membrane-anchored protein YitT (DUF2179 family)
MNRLTGKRREIIQKRNDGVKVQLRDYAVVTFASALYAAAITLFLDPNSLAPGGLTGISIILNRVTEIETGTLLWLLNIPVMLLGLWKFGLRFILSTIYCITLTSVFTNFMMPLGALTHDPFTAALAGGVLVALSVGLILKSHATTGGTDIIVKVLRLRFAHLKTSSLFLMVDVVIVVLSAFVFRDIDIAVYAGLTVFISSMVLDKVLYGTDSAKMIYIISDCDRRITDRLLQELQIGVTHVAGYGAYSGTEKKVILCVVRKSLFPKVEEIVKAADPQSFMVVTAASEVYGAGHKSYFGENL